LEIYPPHVDFTHEAKNHMNLMSIMKHRRETIFCLLLKSGKDLRSTYRLKISLLRCGCNIGPWKEGLFMNVRCPPNTLRNFVRLLYVMGKSLRPLTFVRIRAIALCGA